LTASHYRDIILLVNMNYTLSRKLPLSPYSMFSVVFPGGGVRSETDLPLSAQYRMVGTALIGDDLVGKIGADFGEGYNPFDLYGAAKNGRNHPLPPHLVFVELDNNVEDACAFLNAYGPLDGCSGLGHPLGESELKEWSKASSKSPSPEEHFRAMLGQVPLLPLPATPRDDFHAYPLKQFWQEQSNFELALRLCSALNSTSTDLYQNIRWALNNAGVDWQIEHGHISGVGLRDLPLLGHRGLSTKLQYVNAAVHFVRNTINSHLSLTVPRVVPALDSAAVTGVWGCHSLLDAMYLMLFLDVASRGTRVVQCEKCGTVFYTELESGRYCSALCENRARALRAYHNKKGRS
jgi:hypothetical protein